MTDKSLDKTKAIQKLLDGLYIKSIQDNDYYYSRIETPFFKKEYYVGKFTENESVLGQYLVRLEIKIFLDTLYFIFKENKQKFKSQFISDDEYFDLEFLRFGYNQFLKNFSKTDLENYEEVAFTKYVHGTTNIEGNTYTLRDTELTLNEGLTVAGKKLREFYEIENYARIKRYLATKKSVKFNIELFRKLHSFILKNIDENSAGEIRRVNVGISGTEFTPTPAIFVEEELEKLVSWYDKNKKNLYPIELIARFHQKFEEIHPFIDGNGRVGREILRLMLKQSNFPSIFIGPKNREQYLKSIDSGNSGDHKAITGFIVESLIQVNKQLVVEGMEEIVKSLEKEEKLLKERKFMGKQLEKIKKKLKAIKFDRGDGKW